MLLPIWLPPFTAEEENWVIPLSAGHITEYQCLEYEHWFHGGLQYQVGILFAAAARTLDRSALVEAICRSMAWYRSVGFIEALAECLADFKRLAGYIVTRNG